MQDGRVMIRAETLLGLRPGPICELTNRTLLVLPLSEHHSLRACQIVLRREVRRYRLAGPNVVVSSAIPWDDIGPEDLALQFPSLEGRGDEWVAIASVVVGQLLAFLRCRSEDLRPDDPAVSQSISRVVSGVTLHN